MVAEIGDASTESDSEDDAIRISFQMIREILGAGEEIVQCIDSFEFDEGLIACGGGCGKHSVQQLAMLTPCLLNEC